MMQSGRDAIMLYPPSKSAKSDFMEKFSSVLEALWLLAVTGAGSGGLLVPVDLLLLG